jgi:DNA polymerase-3 subunit epsilon
LEMLTQASGLEVIVTGSALEAALLESDEIKKHAPPYNVALRQRDREIVFFSKDFLQFAPGPDENCAVGPLLSINSPAPFAVISELLGTKRMEENSENIPLAALGIAPGYAPDPDCFRPGFELFRERHNDILKKLAYHFIFTKNPFQGLMTLGREFHLKWLEELARKQAEDLEAPDEDDAGEESEQEEVEAPAEWVWTPEAVANSLEHFIRHSALLVRRARWFCLLSESSLAWDTGKTAGGQRRLLVFRSGGIIHKEDLAEGKEIPFPPGYLRPFHVRQKNFDVMTYDRMRVLTTELRRLVSDKTNRNIQLRLSPTNVLGKEALLKALVWV